jgi:polyisoprenyl-teichoic acid--peptidoglycan teichoic acid transferase
MIDFREKIEEEIGPQFNPNKKKKKRKILLKVFGFLLVFLILFITTALITKDSSESWTEKIPIIGRITGLVGSSDKNLKGEDEDRINAVILGIGGDKHEGGYLTDTIILFSLKPSTKEVAMMSIPRDLYIPIEGMGWQKINTINAFAERKEANSGGEAVSQALSDILNIPIHYYFRIDFQGFIEIIDILEGVDIYVENTLSDRQYPIPGKEKEEDYYSRFQHLYIEKGWHEMDGELALKYVRSRHAKGIEGSDFARSRRQQKIIEAIKNKLLKSENFLRPNMITSIISKIRDNTSFNLKTWEILKFWQLTKNIEINNIQSHVLDNSPSGLLTASRNESGAYILSPRGGDFTEIKYLVNNFFYKKEKKELDIKNNEEAKIELKNGTWINGLAGQIAIDLEKNNFEVLKISNSSKRNFEKTVIYDLSYGSKNEALNFLKESLKADVEFEIPLWLKEEIKKNISSKKEETPDFLVILGLNSNKIGL